jgi:BON domain
MAVGRPCGFVLDRLHAGGLVVANRLDHSSVGSRESRRAAAPRASTTARIGIIRRFSPNCAALAAELLDSGARGGRKSTFRTGGEPLVLGCRVVVPHGLPTLIFLSGWVQHMPALESTLADRVDQAIQTNPYVSGRALRFETDGSRVVLQGAVKSYFQKQMAQEVIRRVEGVEQIDNCLEVQWV